MSTKTQRVSIVLLWAYQHMVDHGSAGVAVSEFIAGGYQLHTCRTLRSRRWPNPNQNPNRRRSGRK